MSAQVGKHLGVNGDHMAAIEYDEQKVRDVLGLPGYGQFYKGNHITTMSYDFWTVEARATRTTASASRSRRSICHRWPTRSTTTGATRPASPPSTGLQKKQALSTFNNHIEILAMVEDTHDGEFLAPPPARQPRAPERGAGRASGPFNVRAVRAVGSRCARRPTRRSANVAQRSGSGGS